MRLTKIKEIIEQHLPYLKLKAEQVPSNGTYLFKVYNIAEIREACAKLKKIPPLKIYANDILGHTPSAEKNEPITLSPSNYEDLSKRISIFTNFLMLSNNFLGLTVKNPNKGTVYLKLPPTTNISDFKKNIEIVDKSFSQLFSGQSEAPKIVLDGVDTGSEWLVLLVEGIVGLKIFLETIKGAVEIAERCQNMKKTAAETRLLTTNNELLQQELDVMKRKRELQIKFEAKKLLKSYGEDPELPSSNDNIIRFTSGIENLVNLFEKGSELEVPKITYEIEEELSGEILKFTEQLQITKQEVLKLEAPRVSDSPQEKLDS